MIALAHNYTCAHVASLILRKRFKPRIWKNQFHTKVSFQHLRRKVKFGVDNSKLSYAGNQLITLQYTKEREYLTQELFR